MTAPRIGLACALLAAACGSEAEAVESRPPAIRPAPPEFACVMGGPARHFDGADPALAVDAVVVHDAEGHATLHRLDAPTEAPRPIESRVLAITRRGAGWVAVLPSRVVELDAEGGVGREAALAGEAVEARIVVDREEAWVITRDAEDEIALHRIALARWTADPPRPVGRGRGRLLLAPGRGAWAGPGATVRTPDGELAVSGAPAALVGEHVVRASPDRTGLWIEDARSTRAWASPTAALAVEVGERLALAYTDDGDLFVQAADPSAGAVGQPALVAPAAVADELVARGERFWIAWEPGDGTVAVRAGECEGG